LKQKINPVVAILVILLVIGAVGAVMYFSSEPPMVNTRKRSFEENRQQMEAMRQGMMAAKQAIEAKKAEKSGGGKPTQPAPDSAEKPAKQGE